MKKIVLYGAGQGSEEILKVIIEDINKDAPTWEVLGFIDDDPSKKNSMFCGLPVFGSDYRNASKDVYCVSGIMNNNVRRKITEEWIQERGFLLPVLIHPTVIRTKDFECGPATVMMPEVKVSHGVKLGKGVIVNYNCVLGHNLVVDDYSFIGPSVTIPGCCKIGKSCLIGAGATFIQGVVVENNVTVGVGTTVLSTLKDGTSMMDMPRKFQSK